jgi:hypothetical protein
MSQNASVRSIRESLLSSARSMNADPIALEALRADALACIAEIAFAKDRAFDFAAKGLVSEAASVVTDFPELAREAEALLQLATSDAQATPIWRSVVGVAAREEELPRRDDIDRLAAIAMRGEELRPLLDALRLSALRREPIQARMRLLRKLRSEDPRNRMWLDQIEALEVEWIRSMSEMRSRAATREELDDALIALEQHEWVASVPRGLREELFAKVRPLRAEEAGGRYQRLADEIADAASRMDRADLVRLEAAWAAVHQETGRMPADELAQLVAPSFAWLTRVEGEEREQQAFDEEVEKLSQLLDARRGVPEIEAQVAVLRDGGRAAPEGLLERAAGYVDAEREAVRRRHRLVLTSSVLSAVVLVFIGVVALRFHAAQREREALLRALETSIAEKDAGRLASLVEEVRSTVGEPTPELAAALEEADGLVSARARRTEEIRALVVATERELAGTLSRARLNVLKTTLATALADAEDADRADVQRIEARRGKALEAIDAAAAEVASGALAAADRSLLPWPMPDAWKDEEQLDEARWSEYIGALELVDRKLSSALAEVDEHESSVSRIGLRRDAIAKRSTEARSRVDALRAAVRDLADERLLAPISTEQQFIGRIEAALKAHGPVLARRGQTRAFEQSMECADGYRAMESWRIKVRPSLVAVLGPTLSDRPSPEVALQASNAIRAFLAEHPAIPMRVALERLASDIDPNAGALLWSAQRVEIGLASERLAGIEEVPLTNGRRFYRRPPALANVPANQKNPLTRALKNLADLSTDPERLSSILEVSASEIREKPFANPVSLAWARAEGELREAQSHEVLPILINLLEGIQRAKESDVLLRFRALRDATGILAQSGHATGKFGESLGAWQAACREQAPDASTADWLAAGYDSEAVNWRKQRSQAEKAIASFPRLEAMRDEIIRESRRIADSLSELVPVGIVAAAGDDGGPRTARISGDTTELFVLTRSSSGWSVVAIEVARGKLVKAPDGMPAGPLLVYRRNRS